MIKKSFVASVMLAIVIFTSCKTGDAKASRKEEMAERQELVRELKFGRAIARKIMEKNAIYKNDKVLAYVNKVGKAVALFAGRQDFEYNFGILDIDQVNAYAAPGGYIFITRGALVAMKNEAQLAGVLAHEIAHVNLRHIMKMLPPPRSSGNFADKIVAVLSAQGTVVSSAMNQVAEKAISILFKEGIQKEAEYEADRTAIDYVGATGYEVGALPNFLKAINKASVPEVRDKTTMLNVGILYFTNVTKNVKYDWVRKSLPDKFHANLSKKFEYYRIEPATAQVFSEKVEQLSGYIKKDEAQFIANKMKADLLIYGNYQLKNGKLVINTTVYNHSGGRNIGSAEIKSNPNEKDLSNAINDASKSVVYYVSEFAKNQAKLNNITRKIRLRETKKSEVYNTHPPLADRILKLNQTITKEAMSHSQKLAAARFKKNMGDIAKKTKKTSL